MSKKTKDYQAWEALTQSGDLVYPREAADDLLFPTLRNCAWLKDRGRPDLWNADNKKNYPDYIHLQNQKYTINNKGFRGQDFKKEPSDILVAGCSQTWGIGIPDGYIWPEILSKRTGLSMDNVGYSGKSIAGIVQIVFCYLREIGNPKYLFIAFPDPFRMIFPTTNNFMHAKNPMGNDDEQDMIANTNLGETRFFSEKPKYATAPYLLEEMMTEEITIWQAVSYIQMLEDYCKAAGIILRYGSWDNYSTDFFDALPKRKGFYESYITLEGSSWVVPDKITGQEYYRLNSFGQKVVEDECHKDLMDDENSVFWYVANDRRDNSDRFGHIGVHRHIHIAEIFEKEILKDGQ